MYSAAVEAPSISVCIPARNETHAMTQCLETVLASDYKKMEVIVYDDSSVDDTSILVRSFAHAGVRFIPGTKLPDGWLGRNHALDTLAREASGTYILFLDVDTVIKPTTIGQLVGYITTENVDMVSVIPQRAQPLRISVLLGTLRYYWYLALSFKATPATSSSAWMINRKVLIENLGGMSDYKAAVQPEARLASTLGVSLYHCLVGSEELGVRYEKRWSSQVEASRRLLYPMVGGRWYFGFLAVIILILLNVPTLVVLSAIVTGWMTLHTIFLILLFAFMSLYAYYAYYLWQRDWLAAAFVWPVVIFQELIIFVQSMVGYSRKTITWKGRPITDGALRSSSIIIND